MTKVVHDTNIGTGLEISGGKLTAASTMATDAEVADAITAQDTAENLVEAQAKLRTDYLMRAQQHMTTAALIQVDGSKVRILTDASNITPSKRVLLMGGGEGTHAGADGFSDLMFPVAGDIVTGLGIADTTVDVNGFIEFPAHGSLYAKIPAAGASSTAPTKWYMAAYAVADYVVPEDCVLVVQHTRDVTPGNMFQLWDGTKLFQGYNYTDTGWIDMTPYFAAGVSVFGGGYQPPRFRRLNNRVVLEGVVNVPTSAATIATLPGGFWPALRHINSANTHNAVARVDVDTAGVVSKETLTTASWISLDGISFGLD